MFLASLTTDQKEAFLCLAHNVVVSDGDLTDDEHAMMEEMRREMELTGFEARYLPIDGIDKIFDTRKSRTIALISLIRLGYADGAFEVEEQCFLQDLCDAFRISDAEFSLIDNWVRRWLALEREATALMGG